MQTENECGDGENTWDYAQYVFNLFRHYFVNGANAYVYWNMVLEPFGLSTWGWKQNSMITVDPETRESIYNPEYYVMKHFSHFVHSSAVRIETTGAWTGNSVAFQNPDGSRVVVLVNPFKDQRELLLSNNHATYRVTLEPDSFNTFILTNEDSLEVSSLGI
jgi:glucosylceramidase